MILGVAAWHPLQLALIIKPTESPRNRARHPIESLGIVGDSFTKFFQLRPRRHPDARAESGFPARLEVEVVAGASGIRFRADVMRCVTVVEPAGCVDLVRRLVLGEADVAVDTEHRSLRISADLRRELRK